MTPIVHKPFQFLCSVALILFCVLGASVAAMAAEKGSADQLPERCRMEAPATGVCKALFEVYSFNPETNVCEESNYGGCGGVVPFQTEEECKRVCETGDRLRLTGIAPEKELPYSASTERPFQSGGWAAGIPERQPWRHLPCSADNPASRQSWFAP